MPAAPCGPAVQDGRSARRAGHGPSAPARQPSPRHPPQSKDGLRPTVPWVAALPAAPTPGPAAPGCVPSRRRPLKEARSWLSPQPADSNQYAHSVAEPRRALIDADYAAAGIWLVTTKEELEAGRPLTRNRPWPLSQKLLSDLKAWNRSWEASDGFGPGDAEARRAWQEQGRELATRAHHEFAADTDDWEVLYQLGGQVHRVHPPGSWPAATWEQDLLGYPSLSPAEYERRYSEGTPPAG